MTIWVWCLCQIRKSFNWMINTFWTHIIRSRQFKTNAITTNVRSCSLVPFVECMMLDVFLQSMFIYFLFILFIFRSEYGRILWSHSDLLGHTALLRFSSNTHCRKWWKESHQKQWCLLLIDLIWGFSSPTVMIRMFPKMIKIWCIFTLRPCRNPVPRSRWIALKSWKCMWEVLCVFVLRLYLYPDANVGVAASTILLSRVLFVSPNEPYIAPTFAPTDNHSNDSSKLNTNNRKNQEVYLIYFPGW